MAIKTKGDIKDYYVNGVVMQPGFELTYKNDGTIEGQVVFECAVENERNLPGLGYVHPRDSRCECYTFSKRYLPLNKIQMTASFFGLTSSTTDSIISYTPNTNQDSVTSHPDFKEFAGTSGEPKNGAKFDDETGEFLGFFDPDKKDLFGVEYYLTPATLLSTTHWQRSVPRLSKRMTIRSSISGFNKPSGVKEFMLLDSPYRQVGSFYQVTEQWMGSGPAGFSRKLYPQ